MRPRPATGIEPAFGNIIVSSTRRWAIILAVIVFPWAVHASI